MSLDDAALLTENLSWFLDLVGDGMTLTGAGYLRPAVVEQISERLRLDREWIGSFNREDLTPGVADFRSLMTTLGLVRKSTGKLLPTKVGAALRSVPLGLLAHVADRLPLGRQRFEHEAALLAFVAVLGGGEPVTG
ncbi:hypothetical protein [Pseudactinotalea sp.]|uniref:hypothetical protein n=1 Tax=Pseudactinotalea sp. TaxID=1926260 RepID=UPI003B3AEDA0